jgi:hypothetical protein
MTFTQSDVMFTTHNIMVIEIPSASISECQNCMRPGSNVDKGASHDTLLNAICSLG